MGNIESTAKIDVAQLQGLRSRELNISRSLGYEEYKKVSFTFIIHRAIPNTCFVSLRFNSCKA